MIHTLKSLGGMVVAPHHLAAQAGRDIFRKGGNAIEAMVAAAPTIAVVYPHMNAIGGEVALDSADDHGVSGRQPMCCRRDDDWSRIGCTCDHSLRVD